MKRILRKTDESNPYKSAFHFLIIPTKLSTPAGWNVYSNGTPPIQSYDPGRGRTISRPFIMAIYHRLAIRNILTNEQNYSLFTINYSLKKPKVFRVRDWKGAKRYELERAPRWLIRFGMSHLKRSAAKYGSEADPWKARRQQGWVLG